MREVLIKPATVLQKGRQKFGETWQSEANLSIFLASLVVVIFVFPLAGLVREYPTVYGDAIYTLMIVSGLGMTWSSRRLFYFAAAVSATALIVRWGVWLYPNLTVVREVTTLASLMLVVGVILWLVFRAGRVTSSRIQGAVAVYLMFGLMWAHAYHLVAHFKPGAFAGSVGTLKTPEAWLYYSFSTLTTLGYGDIIPAGAMVRMIAIGEAITGQLYLAVLVARLVALQVSNQQR